MRVRTQRKEQPHSCKVSGAPNFATAVARDSPTYYWSRCGTRRLRKSRLLGTWRLRNGSPHLTAVNLQRFRQRRFLPRLGALPAEARAVYRRRTP